MTSPSWNPDQYLKFAAERARPFADLVGRIPTQAPRTIVDLGCGAGNVTRTLLDRWPDTRVLGIDSSAEMIAAAAQHASERLAFAVGDLTTWRPAEPVDVIISNATLHWVPRHVDLFPMWIGDLAPGGTFAFQIPANADPRAAQALDTITESPRWSGLFDSVHRAGALAGNPDGVRTPAVYTDILGNLGCAVDAWETTYLHVLPGDDPVVEWFRGSGLRPYLDALDPDDRSEFLAEVRAAFREVFPQRPYGTVLPFRRIFVVAQAPNRRR
jgi:trans-aconitate 2-methyltransferase